MFILYLNIKKNIFYFILFNIRLQYEDLITYIPIIIVSIPIISFFFKCSLKYKNPIKIVNTIINGDNIGTILDTWDLLIKK